MNLKRKLQKIFKPKHFKSKRAAKSKKSVIKSKRSKLRLLKKNEKAGPKQSFLQSLIRIVFVLAVVSIFVFIMYQIILTGLYNYSKFQNINYDSTKVENSRLKDRNWNGKDKISILILGVDYKQLGHRQIDTIILLQIYPETEQISWLFIPVESYIDTSEHGLVPMKNLIMLGDLKKEDYGFSYAVDNLEHAMFLQTDRYFIYDADILNKIINCFGPVSVRVPSKYTIKDQSDKYIVSVFDENRITLTEDTVLDYMEDTSGGEKNRLQRQLLFFEGLIRSFNILDTWRLSEVSEILKKGVYSNMTGTDFFKMIKFVWQKRGELNMEILNPTDLAKTIHQDGRTVRVFEGSELYEIIREVALNQHIIDELARVEVFNGSGLRRAAATYTTIFRNEGIDVIRKNNAPREYDKTTIYVQDESRSYSETIKTLQRILGEDVEVIFTKTGFLSTGDIIVVLGQDLDEIADGLVED